MKQYKYFQNYNWLQYCVAEMCMISVYDICSIVDQEVINMLLNTWITEPTQIQ